MVEPVERIPAAEDLTDKTAVCDRLAKILEDDNDKEHVRDKNKS